MRIPYDNKCNLISQAVRLSISFGLLLYIMMVPAWADAGSVVQITEINGPNKDWFEIKRGDEKIQFSLFSFLQKEDKICVFKPDENDPNLGKMNERPYSITLLGTNRSSDTLSYDKYPCQDKKYFTIKEAEIHAEDGIIRILREWLDNLWKSHSKRAITRIQGSGDEFVVIPNNVSPKLIEGKNVLYLGGQGQHIRLLQKGGKEVPTESLSPGVVKLGEKLTVGQQYTVVVCDKTVGCKDCYSDKPVSGKQTGTFTVVSSPNLSTEGFDNLPEVSQKTLKAFQLLRLNEQEVSTVTGQELSKKLREQEWSFEVYQQVRELLASSSCAGEADPKCHPAYLIREAIEGR